MRERVERLTQQVERMHVDREVAGNKREIDMLRLLDLIDGLLVVAAAMGGPAARIEMARVALAGKASPP
jgi:hypothetical protein